MIGPSFSFTDEQVGKLLMVLTDEDLSIFRTFLQTPISDENPFCVLPSTKLNEDKENRKQFHSLVREEFGLFLTTDTLELENSRSIRVWIKKFHHQEQVKYKQQAIANGTTRRNGNKRQKGPRLDNSGISVGVMMKDPWPKDRPDYLHFRLYKENRDTAEAIQSISRCLRIPPKSFQFCGTKDRRGITVQSVSVYRISIEALKRAILHSSWDKAIRVSHFEYKSYPNRIGGANGNHFEICLRSVSANDDGVINSLFRSLRDNGFLNYYGAQRFGTRSVRTHKVGALLLVQNWKRAVDLLLSPQADERSKSLTTEEDQTDRNLWRREYATGNIDKAHELCPSYLYIEKSLLRALQQSGQSQNYLNAISSLPTSTCHLYLHSVQSLAFNAALSQRVRDYGYKVVVGDLVAVAGSGKRLRSDSTDEPDTEEEDGDNGKVEDVKVIESVEESENFHISDVVLTLVGSSVKISPVMQSFYESFFETRVGCPISIVVSDSLPPQFRLRGAYRKIAQKANNLKWEIHNGIKDTQVLIKSDVDRLKATAGEEEPVASATEATEEKSSKAVVFECDLNSGVYLTMAIREVTSVVDT